MAARLMGRPLGAVYHCLLLFKQFLLAAIPTPLTRGIMCLSVSRRWGDTMLVVYRLQGTEFEWDEQKAQLNITNHGITFEEAAEVFFDPFYQYTVITRRVY
jgi:hypothetical protein